MQLYTWPLEKRYAAALFYLDQAPSTSVSEAQYNRLHALMLQIAYGGYVPSGRLPEFSQCAASDRKKRESEWKSVQHLQKIPAMKQFLELMSDLHPNWHKHRRIYEDFEAVWSEERPSLMSKQRSQPTLDRRYAETVFDRLSSRHTHTGRDKGVRLPQVRTSALSDLQLYDSRRVLATLSPRLPKLDAVVDAAFTVNSLKACGSPKDTHDLQSESRYYRFSSPQISKPEEDFDLAKNALVNYIGSLTGGNSLEINRKQGFEIRSDVEKALNPLLHRLEAIKVPTVDRSQVKFPVVSASKLDYLLRPKLEVMTIVTGSIEEMMSDGKGKALISLINKEFEAAVDSVFEYLIDLEVSLKEVGLQAAESEKQLQTAVTTMKAIQELYSVDNQKYALFDLTKASRSHYEMQITEGLAALNSDLQGKMKELEVTLRSQKAAYFDLERRYSYLQVERDKVVDEIRLVQQGAYADNILIGNLAKDLKRSVGIIKGGDTRYNFQDSTLKKELFELKSELREVKQEYENLKHGRESLNSQGS